MLKHIIKKELLNNLLTARVIICYLIIFILLFTSLVIHGLHYRQDGVTAARAKAQAQAHFNKSVKESETDSFIWRRYVQIPARPVSIFCKGFEREISAGFHLNVSIFFHFMDEVIRDNPVFRIFMLFDASFIVALIVSLLAVFITYDTVSGERERGTLKLVMTGSVSRATIITGKFIGCYLAVVWPVVASFAAALAWLMLVFNIPFSGGDLARLVLFTAVSMGFTGIFVLISLVFSVVCRRSGAALLCSVLVWIFTGLVWPYMSMELSTRITPGKRYGDLISRYIEKDNVELENRTDPCRKMRRAMRRGELDRETFARREREHFLTYFARMYDFQIAMVTGQMAAVKKQMYTGIVLSRFSPVSAFLTAATNLAGTGFHDYIRAEDWKFDLRVENRRLHVEEYERRLELYKDLTISELDRKIRLKTGYDLDRLPSVEYVFPGVGYAVMKSLPELLILMLQGLLLFLTAFYLFIRADR